MPEYTKSESKRWAQEHLRGSISAICLPEVDGRLDERGLRHDVRHCIDVIGAGGLYVHGFYGHFWLLTVEERLRAFEIVVDEAAGAVPIILRAAHQSLETAAALIAHAEEHGADVISLLGPYLGQASDDMVYDWFAELARTTTLGISVFNTAQNGYVMSPELLERVASIENVVALKNHVAPEHTARVRDLVGDEIAVVDPEEDRFLDSIVAHGQRAIFTGTNYMYDGPSATPMRDYVEAALAGDVDRATRLFEAMQPLRDVHAEWVTTPWATRGLCPIATVKLWSSRQGMTGGDVRAPLPRLTDDERERFLADLDDAQSRVMAAR